MTETATNETTFPALNDMYAMQYYNADGEQISLFHREGRWEFQAEEHTFDFQEGTFEEFVAAARLAWGNFHTASFNAEHNWTYFWGSPIADDEVVKTAYELNKSLYESGRFEVSGYGGSAICTAITEPSRSSVNCGYLWSTKTS